MRKHDDPLFAGATARKLTEGRAARIQLVDLMGILDRISDDEKWRALGNRELCNDGLTLALQVAAMTDICKAEFAKNDGDCTNVILESLLVNLIDVVEAYRHGLERATKEPPRKIKDLLPESGPTPESIEAAEQERKNA